MPDVHWERHGIGKMRDYREKKVWRRRFFTAFLAVILVLTACGRKQGSTEDEYDRKEEQRKKLSRDWFDDSQAELDTQKNVLAPTQDLVGQPAIERTFTPEDYVEETENELPHITQIFPDQQILLGQQNFWTGL